MSETSSSAATSSSLNPPCAKRTRGMPYSVSVVDDGKVLLKILRNSRPITPNTIVDTDLLEIPGEVLPPESGKIMQMDDKIGKFSIFLFVFDKITQCSTVTKKNFDGVAQFTEEIKPPPNMSVHRNVAWSFFTLNKNPNDDLKQYFQDHANKLLKEDFFYPTPEKEASRIEILLQTIRNHYCDKNAEVIQVDATRQTQHHCQFTGGGDICIQSAKPETLVVTADIDGTSDELSLSPVRSGTFTSTDLSFEGEKDSVVKDKLKHQLWANMVVATVSKFVNALPSFNENSILKLDEITGYGVAYTGAGVVAFYKLELKFGKQTNIITKVKMLQRPKHYAAAIMDYILDYYFGKLAQYVE
ncbi:uncharacterized protein [Dysidea avara]|uniref:uncharacterized protein isoform X2 n=1 Tax=Dysidea avara TaxID=196820 RepID=UPI003327B440